MYTFTTIASCTTVLPNSDYDSRNAEVGRNIVCSTEDEYESTAYFEQWKTNDEKFLDVQTTIFNKTIYAEERFFRTSSILPINRNFSLNFEFTESAVRAVLRFTNEKSKTPLKTGSQKTSRSFWRHSELT